MTDRVIYSILIVLMPACGAVWYFDIDGPPPPALTALLLALVWVLSAELLLKTFKK